MKGKKKRKNKVGRIRSWIWIRIKIKRIRNTAVKDDLENEVREMTLEDNKKEEEDEEEDEDVIDMEVEITDGLINLLQAMLC